MKELKRLFISAVGAALTACVITFFQYLGAHIADPFSAVSMVAGARAALGAASIYAKT